MPPSDRDAVVREQAANFVAYLVGRATAAHRHGAEAAEGRAMLAHLRRGLGRKAGEAPEMFQHVVPYLPQEASDWQRECFFLVGALFGAHPEDARDGRSLGTVCRYVSAAMNYADSAEKRFMALLRSSPERLPDYLRQAIGLASSQNVPVNYRRLLQDLLGWQDTAKRREVLLEWAQDYWPAIDSPEDADEVDDAEIVTEPEEA